MGTTQRIGNGVKNEPNWGKLSSSITSLAKTIEKLDKLDKEGQSQDDSNADKEGQKENNTETDNEEGNNTEKENISKPKSNIRKYANLEKRKYRHVKNSIDRLIRVGGVSKKISTGKSAKIGRAGLRTTSGIASFFSNVNSSGLQRALNDIGFGTLVGKKTKDVIDYLTQHFSVDSIGMDEIASNSALNEVMKTLHKEVDNNKIESLENLMKSYVDSNKLGDMLCVFFGKYIYEHLWQRFSDRLSQKKGKEVSNETFTSIKYEIEGRVKLLNSNRPLSKIDWKGQEGRNQIEKIFEAILKIEG